MGTVLKEDRPQDSKLWQLEAERYCEVNAVASQSQDVNYFYAP